jgi:hypothetical protein
MAYNNYYGNLYYPQPSYYGSNGAMPDMLNQMKGQYQQPIMQQPIQPQVQNIQPTAPQPNQSNDIIWVQGEAGAKAYLVAPNNTVTLWDSESPTIYLKTADANGVPSMRVLDFTERTENAPKSPSEHDCKCGNNFIPKEELNAINSKFDGIDDKIRELEDKINALSAKPATKPTKTTKSEE